MSAVTELFLEFLTRNVIVSIIILAVLLVRMLLHTFPKKYSYILWIFVGIRMVFDISISSGISLLGFIRTISTSWLATASVPFRREEMAPMPAPNRDELLSEAILSGNKETLTVIENTTETVYSATGEIASSSSLQEIAEFLLPTLSILWIIGILVILGYGIFTYSKCKKAVCRAVRLHKNIWECDNISSPFVLGLFSPQIYLPFHLEGEEQKYIIEHEHYHIRRKDYLCKPIAYILLTIYWINPLVWIAFHLMSRDMEMSCDEAVLEKFGNQIKKSYSTSLLSFAEGRKKYSFAPIAFGESDAGKRIRNILSFKKPKIWLTFLLLIIIVVFGIACLTDSHKKETASASDTIEENPNDAGEDITENVSNYDSKEEKDFAQNTISPELYRIYMDAVKQLADNKLFPNGQPAYPYIDEGVQSENGYQIMDVDGDGRHELLINYPNGDSMAAMCYYIFDYDMEQKAFYAQLEEWPGVTIYDNGIIIAMASHNHGRSSLDDFWPYSVYQYEKSTDTYKRLAWVDAWQNILYDGAEPDADFPHEKDIDGDGVLYYFPNENTFEPEIIMDNATYEKWIQDLIAGAKKIDIVYKNIIEEKETTHSSVSQDEQESIYAQMKVIAENKQLWMSDLDYADEIYQYTITDLDRNGRYEIIVTNMGGTGHYSYNRFFEVNPYFDGIEECETGFIEGDSEPDLISDDWTIYMDDTSGQFYYIVKDFIKVTATEYHENIRAISLKLGKVEQYYIASKTTTYTNGTPSAIYSYKDAQGNPLSEAEYAVADQTYFSDGYSRDNLHLTWSDIRALPPEPSEIAAEFQHTLQD